MCRKETARRERRQSTLLDDVHTFREFILSVLSGLFYQGSTCTWRGYNWKLGQLFSGLVPTAMSFTRLVI